MPTSVAKTAGFILFGLLWVGCHEDQATIRFLNNTAAYVDVTLNGQLIHLDPYYEVSYFREVGTKADYSVTIKLKPGTTISWTGTKTFESTIQTIPIDVGPEYFWLAIVNNTMSNYRFVLIQGDTENASFSGDLPMGKITNLGYYNSTGNTRIIVRSDSSGNDAYVFKNGVDYILYGTVNVGVQLELK